MSGIVADARHLDQAPTEWPATRLRHFSTCRISVEPAIVASLPLRACLPPHHEQLFSGILLPEKNCHRLGKIAAELNLH